MKRGFNVLLLFTIIFVLFLNFISAYEIFYYHTDNLGSPVAITDENASVVWSADYEPFGKSFNEFGAGGNGDNDYKYNSKELDDSGLLYYGARSYDADIGRFTTADTIAGNINFPQTLNRYAYTLNNPMKYVDSKGNEPTVSAVKFWATKSNTATNLFSETFYNTMGVFATLATPNVRGQTADVLLDTPSDIKTFVTGKGFSGESSSRLLALAALAIPAVSAGKLGALTGYVGKAPDAVKALMKERQGLAVEIVQEGGPLDKYLLSQGVDPSTATVELFGSTLHGISPKKGTLLSTNSDIDLLITAQKKNELWFRPAGPNKVFTYKGVDVEVITKRHKGIDWETGMEMGWDEEKIAERLQYDNMFNPKGGAELIRGPSR